MQTAEGWAGRLAKEKKPTEPSSKVRLATGWSASWWKQDMKSQRMGRGGAGKQRLVEKVLPVSRTETLHADV